MFFGWADLMLARKAAHLAGTFSAVIVVFFWTTVFTANRWHFPLRSWESVVMMLLAALAASIFACVKGSRRWTIAFIGALLTFLIALFGRV